MSKKERNNSEVNNYSYCNITFFFVIGKNFIDETRNSIILLKSSDFFPLNIIFILIFGIILIFDGISILMDKIKKILILLISKEKVKKFYEK